MTPAPLDATPERLAENVQRRMNDSESEVCAYWMQVIGDREGYATQLRSALQGSSVVPIVIRDHAFNNPNSAPVDLMRLIEKNQADCERALRESRNNGRVGLGVILLSRTPLSIPQIASPARLPDWFADRGGQTTQVIIEDLTWAIDAPLNCAEANIPELCEKLHALDGTMVRRLVAVRSRSRHDPDAFFRIIRVKDDEDYRASLSAFDEYQRAIANPRSFRPSLREGRCLTARLWRIVQTRTPEDLQAPSKAFAKALELPPESPIVWRDSIESVMRRPSNRDGTPAANFIRNALISMASASQFITAAAHADSYARYPIPLTLSLSYDIRLSLAEIDHILVST